MVFNRTNDLFVDPSIALKVDTFSFFSRTLLLLNKMSAIMDFFDSNCDKFEFNIALTLKK